MIAGIAHLSLETELSRGIELGVAMGFQPEFVDEVALPAGFEGIEGIEGQADDRLPLALLASPGGIRLEIVQHRQHSGHTGAYAGVFRCQSPNSSIPVTNPPELRGALRSTGILHDPTRAFLAPPHGEAWFESSPAAGGLVGIVCTAPDARAEADFWSEFARFTWQPVTSDVVWASISSPVQRTRCEFIIAGGDRVSRVHAMNDSGFPSIGVISTSIERDCRRAVAAGATLLAEPIVTPVGGRSLRMALIETPGGAPVELMSAHRPRGR